jgi:quinoprotein glucose dehydrogenase
VLFCLAGAALAAGGTWLAALGGSIFYLAIGAGVILTGGLLIVRRRSALLVYGVVLIATLIWALSEVGFDWWPLAARGDVIFPLGLWLLTPWVSKAIRTGGGDRPRLLTIPLWVGVLAGAVVIVIALCSNYHEVFGAIRAAEPRSSATPQDQPDADWRSYGRTEAGQRYSPLEQITPANVSKLKVAWVFRTGDMPGKSDPIETTFEVTPLKVDNTLYLCSQHQRLFALDAATGKLDWTYDPKIRDDPTFQHLTCRGVSYHETLPGDTDVDGAPAPTDCPQTVFLPVNDGRMIALNAQTGQLCQSFADHGTLHLQQGMGVTTSGFYEPTSPPVVSDKILVVGGAVTDNYSTHEPSGVVRGFDIHTGKLVWSWDAGALNENQPPSATHTYTNNSPNSWTIAAYDPKLGLLYLPMGVQTPDIWGGNRTPAAERYSSALVALDIATGRRVWSYQTVHHDLWDMDLPAQPTLVDLTTPSGPVPAILQPAKSGDLFVLDRRTGRLIVPAPERAVPQGAAPGDHVAPTQPFSALSFRPPQKLRAADMWGATIFDQLACRIEFQRLRYDGTFTPPSLQGTIVYPGNLGMFEWGGIAVDPVRQIAIANPISMPFVSKLIPRGPGNPANPSGVATNWGDARVQPMYGTPYGVVLHPLVSRLGLPCLRPPWGYLAGIDLKTLKVVWLHKNGTVRDSSPIPLPLKMGVPSLGGPMMTAGGVAFLTSTKDYYIRAYDVRDGRQLWQDRLPAGGQSTPMSYAVGGRQYLVTAAGGHGSFGTKPGDFVIAYRLAD